MLQSEEKWACILRNRILRRTSCINHHISSSIWCGIKAEFQTIKNNTTWIIGKGDRINFQLDSWCGDPIAQVLNLDDVFISSFPQNLSNYINNSHWSVPNNLNQLLPNLISIISKVTIPIQSKNDKLLRSHSSKGDLTTKDAYLFKRHVATKIPQAKCIWSIDIPPSKSLLVWRFILNKLPTDENLSERGCHIPSMCSLCTKQVETSFHLFLECPYVVHIWCWFAYIINMPLQFLTKEDIWSLCNRNWNAQCKVVITAALVNIFNVIQFARNQLIFQNIKIPWKSSISTNL